MAAEDILKGNVIMGVMVGVAVSALAPVLLAAGKPLLRSAVKAGILMYERGRESLDELRELVKDAAAEAHTELAKSQQAEVDAAAAMVAASTAPPSEAREPGLDTAGTPQ